MTKFCRFFVFNPDNEMAIANESPYYMPPANIGKMAEDLAYLPAYFSEERDVVWVKELPDAEFIEERKKIFNIHPFLFTGENWEGMKVEKLRPWGWSPRMYFLLQKLNPGEWRKERKELYSRRQAKKCLESLCQEWSFVDRETLPVECHDLLSVEKAAKAGEYLVKAPWSSSGRGILRINGEGLTVKNKEQLKGILKKQGYVMVEREQEKLVDFAMEFYADKMSVKFIGLSCFMTGMKGEYTGNYIGSQKDLEVRLTAWVKAEMLEKVKSGLVKVLTDQIAPVYSGYLGVDMMIYRHRNGEVKLQPCLEINLRYTMGILALFLSDRFIAEGSEGVFGIIHHTSDGEALEVHENAKQESPLVMQGQQIERGYVALTPVGQGSRFTAYLRINKK